jgi:hypothetical protein
MPPCAATRRNFNNIRWMRMEKDIRQLLRKLKEKRSGKSRKTGNLYPGSVRFLVGRLNRRLSSIRLLAKFICYQDLHGMPVFYKEKQMISRIS